MTQIELEQRLSARTPAISVVVLTLNEEVNIADCLRSCAWSDDVHVIDAGSSDRTCQIARDMGATVHLHPFSSFGDQRNWAIDNVPHKHEWVFHLDADERFTPELIREMDDVIARSPSDAGFFVPHKMMFMGRWLRHAEGGYPIYQMRLFHRSRMRFRDHGHGQREDTKGMVGVLSKPYLHYNFSKGLEDWIDKHNRYSTLEAREEFKSQQTASGAGDSPFGGAVARRRFFKSRVYPKLPGKWLGRFVWMYILRCGFLDGRAGLHYCLLVCTYDLFTSLKTSELRRQAAGHSERSHTKPVRLEKEEPAAPVRRIASEPHDLSSPAKSDALSTNNGNGRTNDSPPQPIAAAARPPSFVASPREESPWSLMEKIARVLWMVAGALLFRSSFHNWYAWRRVLLRCFGARIGRNVRIRPTARIEIPWNLEIGDNSTIGDHVILYSLGKIRIGQLATISQYAHLCAGTHDYTVRSFPLLRPPIVIGDEVWVAADAFVHPGVTIGDRSIVGARATVVRDVPPDQIVAGNPARFIKSRVLHRAEVKPPQPDATK